VSGIYGCPARQIGFTLRCYRYKYPAPEATQFVVKFAIMMSTVKHIHLILAAFLVLAAGCDRGAHPRQMGRPAPDFTVADGSRSIQLADYRGKIVVLNFWASWCTYCAAEWPSMEQLQQKIPNLVVLAVAFDSNADDYRQYVIDNQLHNMTVVLDPTDKSNLAFGTARPPETYIIDQHGVIRRKFIGAQDWANPEILEYLRRL
jgi:cytochrome c biogenesis protein CcmG, thiol:disulfide interchange protein DsbE